ncbi:MAG: hypothetical protein Q8M98_09945 [Candidatus Cloacimonadaceae bacterium]|nr:hypothetical protein [Candidatus Cloacimonadaceae bacterium]
MKQIMLVAMLLIIVTAMFGITALHVPPLKYTVGEDVSLRVEIEFGLEELKEVRIRYRVIGAIDYLAEPMLQEAPGSIWFVGMIPAIHVANQDIEYYFEFIKTNLEVELMPIEDGIKRPYSISAAEMKGKREPGFILLSTDEDVEQKDGYLLAVSFFSITENLDPNSIKVWVGGKDVTKHALITENAIVYRDDRARAGLVKAFITATIDDVEVQSETWISTVSGRGSRTPIELRGRFSYGTNLYDLKQDSVTQTNRDHAAWLEMYSTYGILNTNTNLYVSSLEDNNLQPVNRYTFGLQLPALHLVMGDYSPSISPLTMNNRNLRGAYGQLNAKYLGAEFAIGEMVRKTEYIPQTGSNVSTFKQEAIGARIRLGMENGFSFGLNVTRNRDVVSSLDPRYFIYSGAAGDSLFSTTPKDNAVISMDARLAIPNQNVLLGVEIAGSLLNRNTFGGPISSEEIEDYVEGFDFVDPEALADIFVINKNMEPLFPSMANTAWTAYYRTYFWNNFLNINYSVTGPAFNALSTYYQQNDTQVLNFTDQFNIGRFLNVSGGYNNTMDNYSKTKNETNRYDSWFVQGVIRFPRMPYLKASYHTTDTKNINNAEVQQAADFVPFTRNASSISVGLGYNAGQIRILPSQLDITYRMGEDNSITNETLDYENFNNSLNISLSNRLLIFPLKTQFVFSIANQERELPDPQSVDLNTIKKDNFTLFAKGTYELFNKRLIPFAHYRWVNLTGDQIDQSYNYITLGLEAYPIRDLSISTEIGQKHYKNDEFSSLDSDALTWRLLLTQRF